ncbi:RNA ligase RtcB family protein [Hyphomicrobium sp.]|uniref:RNA ligase RtcB family protein n=1 Tax=Hyphomicrobium sp. TaxID=82 RepID=UPI002E35D92A|nr:RNA ligase RtcB family protein [Hyphomicrobium sp.]HEX2843433.1 RNA ligase RtcB family protein [Hyphomicrobium sp.]
MGNSSKDVAPSEPVAAPAATSNVRLFTSDKSWIEGAALAQLNHTAGLKGMVMAAGFPDLHPGKGIAVGAAFVSRGLFYPALAGNDIGCGMSFWATDVSARKLKLDRLEKRVSGLEQPWGGDLSAWRTRFGLDASLSDAGLGTIGGGNHFAELQVVDEVRDAEAFARLGLDKANATLLIHSGSRGLGQDIFRELLERHGANPLEEDSEAAAHYLARHDHAMRFARANRALIAHRFASELGADARCVSDVAHNMVTREDFEGAPAWFHRKGAASTREALDQGALMIPGSRGTPSYLVRALASEGETAAWSLAHGAGRRWQRGYAKSRLSHKYRVEDLARTELDGRVICEDRELLYDEAPQAYKDIAQVIADLEAARLIATIAVYHPVLTYKVRRARDE